MTDDFDKWCKLWDKAQKDGIFEDAPKPPIPTSLTSDPSFFGPINTHHSNSVKDCDSQYWNDVFDLMTGNDPQVINEEKKESTKEVLKKSAEAIARSPNPIQASSAGEDQDLSPGSLGLTYGENDIEKLTELKLQLHDLTSKMASFIGDGKNKQLENKISVLKKKIDEFSSELSRSLGDKKSVQGSEIAPEK